MSGKTISEKLDQLNIELPKAPDPVAEKHELREKPRNAREVRELEAVEVLQDLGDAQQPDALQHVNGRRLVPRHDELEGDARREVDPEPLA